MALEEPALLPSPTSNVGQSQTEAGPAPTILLVEDSAAEVRRLRDELALEAGAAIRVVHRNGLLPALRSQQLGGIDAILLDLPAGDPAGLSLLLQTRSRAAEIPVIVLTDQDDDAVAGMAIRNGAQGCVVKHSTSGRRLARIIRHAIERNRLVIGSQRKLRELEHANARLRSLVEDNPDAIVVLDIWGFVRFANPAAEVLLGRPVRDLLDSSFGVPLRTGEDIEFEISRPGDGPRILGLRLTQSQWDGERAYVATLRDISERRRSEASLLLAKQAAERANLMKSRFLASMSHELRTPLNSIIGFAELMQVEIFGPLGKNRYREYVDYIQESGSHLLSLINNLLDLSKAEAGKLELDELEFDVTRTIDAALRSVAPHAAKRQVSLVREGVTEPLLISADDVKLKQIVLNLLTNAVKFTRPKGEVRVGAYVNARGELTLTISDNGIGIPADQIPRAFTAFAHVENAYVCKLEEGSGLGLALTKRLVELHGGTIKLQSKVNVGTRVTVKLPPGRVVNLASPGARRLASS